MYGVSVDDAFGFSVQSSKSRLKLLDKKILTAYHEASPEIQDAILKILNLEKNDGSQKTRVTKQTESFIPVAAKGGMLPNDPQAQAALRKIDSYVGTHDMSDVTEQSIKWLSGDEKDNG